LPWPKYSSYTLHKNWDTSSFEPAEQLSINKGSRFTLTKVLWSYKTEKINSRVSTVIKNMYNSTSINCIFIKFEIQVVSTSPNNCQLIKEVDLLWPKCSSYALHKIWDTSSFDIAEQLSINRGSRFALTKVLIVRSL